MNKKDGFTLVELMAILLILSVLLLVAVPSITSTFRNSETNELEEYTNTLCMAAQSYMEIEEKSITTTKQAVNLNTLRQEGYIVDTLKNPSTNALDTVIYIKKASSGEIACSLN